MSTTDFSAHLSDDDRIEHARQLGLSHGSLTVIGRPPSIDPRLIAAYPERAHNCYELSIVWIQNMLLGLDDRWLRIARPLLIHGSVQGDGYPRIGHSWVSWRNPDDLTTRSVYDPVHTIAGPEKGWRKFTSSREHRVYDPDEMQRQMLRADNYGPWHRRPFGFADCPHGLDPDACTIDTCPGPARPGWDTPESDPHA